MQTPQGGSAYSSIRFDAIVRAWAAYQSQMGMWLAITLIVLLATSAFALIFGLIMASLGLRKAGWSGSLIASPIEVVGSIMVGSVWFFLEAGALNAAMKQIRGQGLRLEYLTEILSFSRRLAVVAFLVAVATTIASLFYLVPSFFVSGLLMFSIPLAIDNDISGIEAIRRSFDMLKSQWLKATLFWFVASVVGIVGILACGIGIIFTMPVFFLSIAIAYDDCVRGAVEE